MKKRYTAILFLTAILGASIFGIQLGMSHGMDDGPALTCIFMNEPATICPMMLAEHMNKWQQTFIAVESSVAFLFSFLLLVLIFSLFREMLVFQRTFPAGFALSLRDGPESNFFTPLFAAFADGILHPRLYA